MPNHPKRLRRSVVNPPGARGPGPQHYKPTGYPVLGIRLPEEARRLLDHVALTLGADVTPSMLGRAAVERFLRDLGFDLTMPEAALPADARERIAAWLVTHELDGDGAEPPTRTS
jgi:hypothetical protein